MPRDMFNQLFRIRNDYKKIMNVGLKTTIKTA